MYGMRKLILLSVMLCITGASGVRAQRYDRGFERSSIAFVEKGTWTAGGSVAYSAHKNDNYRFFVIEDINSTGYRFSLNPGFCYIVRDNMGLGARFSYGRQLLKVERANISIDEIDINVKDYYALSHDYSVMAIYRNYIPIGNSRRFAIYSEMQIGLGQIARRPQGRGVRYLRKVCVGVDRCMSGDGGIHQQTFRCRIQCGNAGAQIHTC